LQVETVAHVEAVHVEVQFASTLPQVSWPSSAVSHCFCAQAVAAAPVFPQLSRQFVAEVQVAVVAEQVPQVPLLHESEQQSVLVEQVAPSG
jgi:hypothetical protein